MNVISTTDPDPQPDDGLVANIAGLADRAARRIATQDADRAASQTEHSAALARLEDRSRQLTRQLEEARAALASMERDNTAMRTRAADSAAAVTAAETATAQLGNERARSVQLQRDADAALARVRAEHTAELHKLKVSAAI